MIFSIVILFLFFESRVRAEAFQDNPPRAGASTQFVRSAPGSGPAEDIDISGKVVNRTWGHPLAGQEVALVRHLEGEAFQVTSVTGEDGNFRFDGEGADSASMVLMTTFQGVPYVVSGNREEGGDFFEIAVYDTTSSDEQVQAEAYHIFANAHGSDVEILEILALRNGGNRTLYGDGGASLRIPLPEGFSDLKVDQTASRTTAWGFVSEWPFPPGNARLRYRYRLPADGRFLRPVPYHASMVSVLIHPSDIAVESVSLDNQGVVDFEGQQFLHLIAQNVPRGLEIGFRTIGEEAGLPRDLLKWGLLAFALILGAAALLYRPRKKPSEEEQIGGNEKRKDESRRTQVVRDIAMLDDAFEAGQIEEATYRSQRSILMEEAVRLTEEQGQDDA